MAVSKQVDVKMTPFYKSKPEFPPEVAEREMQSKVYAIAAMAYFGVPLLAGLTFAAIYQLNIRLPWLVEAIGVVVAVNLTLFVLFWFRRSSLLTFFILLDCSISSFFLLFCSLMILALSFDQRLVWAQTFQDNVTIFVVIAVAPAIFGFILSFSSFTRHAKRIELVFAQKELSPADVYHSFFSFRGEGKWSASYYVIAAAASVGFVNFARSQDSSLYDGIPFFTLAAMLPIGSLLIGGALGRWSKFFSHFRKYGDIVIKPPFSVRKISAPR